MTTCKIFVGGLSWDTTDERFSEFFSQFGEIEEAVIIRNKISGGSRGFGFVTFTDVAPLDKVLKTELHLDGRKIECKAAVPRDSFGQVGSTKKLFVGGLAPETTQEAFQAYFEKFGNVVEALIMMDHNTQRSRGFGFVTFDSGDVVEKVMAISTHIITDKQVECKKAIPRHMTSPQQMQGGYFGMGGMGGMGGMAGFGGGRGRGGGFYPGYMGYGGMPYPQSRYFAGYMGRGYGF